MKLSTNLRLGTWAAVVTAAAASECFEDTVFSPKDWSYCHAINDNLFMYYTPSGDNVMLGLHAKQDVFGWSSLSLAGNGGMKGASQIIVRRDESSDQWVAEDRSSLDYITPNMDDQQDVQLLFAEQDEATGETSWGVVLPQNSCDDQDYEIQDQKRFLLWAYGTNHDFSFHGNNRGQFMANLMVKPAEPANLEEYDKISLTMPNVEVVRGEPDLDPTNPFICTVFDMDTLSQDKGFSPDEIIHMVGYDVKATPGSEKYLHHQVLFTCDGDSSFHHNKVIQSCTSMPVGCTVPVAVWAVGADANVFPEDVGLAIGGSQRWLVLQMHYFNKDLDEGVYDSSGLDVYFAKEARPIEGGMMFFIPGAATGQHPPLPGGQDDVAMETLYVESECTSQWTEPLTVVQVHHHSHFMGLHQEVLVERDGKMLGPLRREKRYDYNHQSGVEPEANLRTLLPGDRLAATCHFDTSSVSSNSLVEIGEESNREMCVPFIFYYPRQEAMSFTYFPPKDFAQFVISDYEWCSKPPTEPEGSFGSLCVEKLYQNVTEFYKTPLAMSGYDGPSLSFTELCNGGDATEEAKKIFPICPTAEVAEARSSARTLVSGAKEVCEAACNTVGLSLHPDLSRTELFPTVNMECPTPMFDPLPLAEPEACQIRGRLPVAVTLDLTGKQDSGNLGRVTIDLPESGANHLYTVVPSLLVLIGASMM